MNTFFSFSNPLAELEDVQRQMARLFADAERRTRFSRRPSVRANVVDNGEAYVVEAALPGVGTDDLDLNLTGETLTIAARRTVEVPDGYSIHRQERPTVTFSRSFTFSTPVDSEHITARLTDGWLTVQLPKAASAQPRRITVTSD